MLGELWTALQDWFASWQWGNVPSWFSAGSFMAAAIVIFRDRKIRRRNQIDNLGIWGEFSVAADDNSGSPIVGKLVPKIHVKNPTNLPARIESIHYEVTFSWCVRYEEGYFMPVNSGWVSFKGHVADFPCPPGETVTAIGKPVSPGLRPMGMEGTIITSEAPGNRISIERVVMRDHRNHKWKVVPKVGFGDLAATSSMPLMLAQTTSNVFAVLTSALVDQFSALFTWTVGAVVATAGAIGSFLATSAAWIARVFWRKK
ncbi:hypothetical protein [Amycolatopsis sp. WGS_07]|uniref:hypothetical protein n=1 Tax=Amycolatopsis sp. WGS_07 TaxID=3076764 RepID=UPI00387363B6